MAARYKMLRVAIKVAEGRWFMIFAAFLIMSFGGGTYIFSIYSEDIKEAFNYDQQTLNTLSFFKDLGTDIGIISGVINNYTPPWVGLLVGATMNVFGYVMIWLAVTGRTKPPNLWQMLLYIFIGANSHPFIDTPILVTSVKNFPESRGVVIGLLKAFVGLSGAIIAQLYYTFYGNGDNSKGIILLIGWLPTAITVLLLPTIRVSKVVPLRNELKVFFKFLYIILTLTGYLGFVIVIEKLLTLSAPLYRINIVVILIMLFSPLVLVIKEEISLSKIKRVKINKATPVPDITTPATTVIARPTSPASTLPEVIRETTHTSRLISVFKSPKRGEDYTILQALVSIDMLLLFFTTMCALGGTLTTMNSMGQIGKSQGYPKQSINTLVSLSNIWNALGRLASGFLSEIFLARYKFPRPLMVTLILLLSCVGYLLIAFAIPNSLYFSSMILGFCFGAEWTVLPAIISEIFGLKYYSTLYNIGAIASPIGSFLLNVRLTGHLYDKEAAKQQSRTRRINDESACVGSECFKLPFIIITAVSFLGVVFSIILVMRTREFYSGNIYAKFQKASMEETQMASVVEARPVQTMREDDDGNKEREGAVTGS